MPRIVATVAVTKLVIFILFMKSLLGKFENLKLKS